MPSSFRSATLGGWFGNGFGGVASINHGPLVAPGLVKKSVPLFDQPVPDLPRRGVPVPAGALDGRCHTLVLLVAAGSEPALLAMLQAASGRVLQRRAAGDVRGSQRPAAPDSKPLEIRPCCPPRATGPRDPHSAVRSRSSEPGQGAGVVHSRSAGRSSTAAAAACQC